MFISMILSTVCSELSTGAEISFEPTTYTVLESGEIQDVCTVLSSGTEIPLSLTLVVTDGSAISKFINFMTAILL